MSSTLVLSATAAATTVEGPHRRFVVWVSGCEIRCPGCCNPDMFERASGREHAVADLLSSLRSDIEGITVLGGEPLQQLRAVTELCIGARHRGLGVFVSTGMSAREARAQPGFDALWRSLDTLCTGPYLARRPEPDGGRAFIGSSNQRLLHRTTRYRDPALWLGPRAAEVVVDARGGATVLGAPSLVARVRRRLAAAAP